MTSNCQSLQVTTFTIPAPKPSRIKNESVFDKSVATKEVFISTNILLISTSSERYKTNNN